MPAMVRLPLVLAARAQVLVRVMVRVGPVVLPLVLVTAVVGLVQTPV